jgi:hypothetical protein
MPGSATAPATASMTPAATAANVVQAKSSSPATITQHENASGDTRVTAASAADRTRGEPQHTQAEPLPPKLEQAVKTHDTPSRLNSAGSGQGESMPMTPGAASLIAAPSLPQAESAKHNADQIAGLMHTDSVAPLAVGVSPLNTRSDSQMFFDVGRFKKDWMAQDLSNKVAQLGIRTSVVQRGHLWMSSYQVLAGPYNNEAAEKELREKLVSHGYEARPYERGSRDFSFHSKVSVRGSQLPAGDLSIDWETYVTDTKVKFMQRHYLVAAVEGKWVHHDSKFLNNEYVYQIQRDASQPLLELHFAGMDRALVLNNLR